MPFAGWLCSFLWPGRVCSLVRISVFILVTLVTEMLICFQSWVSLVLDSELNSWGPDEASTPFTPQGAAQGQSPLDVGHCAMPWVYMCPHIYPQSLKITYLSFCYKSSTCSRVDIWENDIVMCAMIIHRWFRVDALFYRAHWKDTTPVFLFNGECKNINHSPIYHRIYNVCYCDSFFT